jgi:arylformamidase
MDREFPVDSELEQGYNVSLSRPDFQALLKEWIRRSEEFRTHADSRLDCAYDQSPRDRIDLFRCGDSNAPLLVFIHGGYWQRGDKNWFSFIADAFVQSGVDVALIGYQLCPHTNMSSIVSQIRKAMVWLWRNARSLGISAERINLCGHSAGGQLTAMMLATEWNRISTDVPAFLVKTGIPISGLYQLEPLRHTTINDALGMDASCAHENSPQFLQPSTEAPILVTLGGAETGQFHSQKDQFVERWREFDAPIEAFIEPGVDHYEVINRLAESDSDIFKKIRDWLQ